MSEQNTPTLSDNWPKPTGTLFRWPEDANPDFVIVNLGINDIYSPSRQYRNDKRLPRKLKKFMKKLVSKHP